MIKEFKDKHITFSTRQLRYTATPYIISLALQYVIMTN